MTAQIDFGRCIDRGFQLYKNNFGLLVVPSLLAFLLTMFSMGLLAGPMAAGMVLITLALLDGTEPKPEIGTLFKGFDYFLPAFLFALVWGVIFLVAHFILNLVPCVGQLASLALSIGAPTLLMFGMFLIVEKRMEFWPASLASFEVVKVNYFPYLGIFLVASLLGSLGAILCGIGIFLTMPLTGCILAVAYRDHQIDAASPVTPDGPPEPPSPPYPQEPPVPPATPG